MLLFLNYNDVFPITILLAVDVVVVDAAKALVQFGPPELTLLDMTALTKLVS